ncbi:hypothetical protein D3C80_2016140 [compost metagenome]
MTIQTELSDTDAHQCAAHFLYRVGTFRVQLADVIAKQHFVGQAKFPAVIGQLEPLRLQQGNLLGRQALRFALAAGEGQQGDKHHRQQ